MIAKTRKDTSVSSCICDNSIWNAHSSVDLWDTVDEAIKYERYDEMYISVVLAIDILILQSLAFHRSKRISGECKNVLQTTFWLEKNPCRSLIVTGLSDITLHLLASSLI